MLNVAAIVNIVVGLKHMSAIFHEGSDLDYKSQYVFIWHANNLSDFQSTKVGKEEMELSWLA